MSLSQVPLFCKLAAPTAAALALLSLSACSQPTSSTKDQPTPSAASSSTTASSALPKELPAQYKSWPVEANVGACSIDPARINPDGSIELTGWGVINAAAGEVPETFVLQIDKEGTSYYVAANLSERKDVADKLSNPALAKSGFSAKLPAQALQLPFTVTALLGFQQKFFPCEHKLEVK